jgi:pyruvate ferredoxin oxidoreductase alpha subunit
MDSVIMAYRLAEDFDIQLPVMLNYDGYYVSYSAEAVKIPQIEDVDRYLSVLKNQPERMKLVPGKPMGIGTHGILLAYTEMRYKHMAAMERAKAKFDQVDKEFLDYFGRAYGGQLEEYRTEDADFILITSGSATGTARTVIDRQREKGVKVGLIKLRMYRPFPRERLVQALKGKKAIGVLDRSIGFGWNCGPMYAEVLALSPKIGPMPTLSFIDGLANMDITVPNIEKMIAEIRAASLGQPYQEVTWMALEE